METNENVNYKTWTEFRKSGMFFFINTLLHFVGWTIIFQAKGDEVLEVRPARIKFRGWTEEAQDTGFPQFSKFLAENGSQLHEETKA